MRFKAVHERLDDQEPDAQVAERKARGGQVLFAMAFGLACGVIPTWAVMSTDVDHYRNVSIEIGCAAKDRDGNFYWRQPGVTIRTG